MSFNFGFKTWMIGVCFVAVFVVGTLPAFAQNFDAVLPGWYVSLNQSHTPAQIVADEGRLVIAYTIWYDDMTNPTHVAAVSNYLNTSYQSGLKVILGVENLVRTGNISGLTLMVNMFKGHPALAGWYLLDEPNMSDGGILLGYAQQAQAVIRANSDKPIFVVFWDGNILDGSAAAYKDTYDIMMHDKYGCSNMTSEEFSGMEDHGSWTGWRNAFDQAKTVADNIDRPMYSVVQAVGEIDDPNWTYDFRLPTLAEERYMAAYSLLNGAKGVIFWADYRRAQSIANSSAVYPYDGEQWLIDVAKPMMAELNTLSRAVVNDPVAGGVSVSHSDILAGVYQDSDTGEHYLYAVNRYSASRNVTFDLDLSQLGFDSAIPIFETADYIELDVNQQFNETFSPYQVHTYLLADMDVHFSDDFEGQSLGAFGDANATVGDWHILGVNDTSFVDIVDSGDSHGQVMRVYGAGNSRAWAQFASQTDSITVSYDIKVVEPSANGYGTCYQWIKNTNQGWDEHGTTVSLRKDWSMTEGRIYHGATYTAIPLADYAYQWYNVAITFSAIPAGGVMGDCDVKVIRESTGEVVVDETGVANNGIDLTAFNVFEFTGSGTHLDVYVDNVVVYSLGSLPDYIDGDANGDGAVDVGDLGILAANYGLTVGATWSVGDFNADGAVDVGDLGILAANYGTGASGADFEADYAKVFGVVDAVNDADEINDVTCGSWGLLFVSGLFLIGLMLVKE